MWRGFVLGVVLLSILAGGEVGAQQVPNTVPIPEESESPEQAAAKEQKVRELRRRVRQDMVRHRWAEAVQEMKELVLLDPYNADYQLTLGLLFRKQGAQDDARRKFQDFLNLGGNAAVAHVLMAEGYAARKQKNEAFRELQLAAENGMNIMRAASNFEALREYRSDTEFIKLALKLERYDLNLRSSEISDIFTSRFDRADAERDEEPDPVVAGVWDKKRQEKELRRIKLQLSNVENYLSIGNEDRAMEHYQRLLEMLERQNRFTVPAFATEVRAIINKKDEIERGIQRIRIQYLWERARTVSQEMRRYFKEEDYPEVERRFSELERIAASIVAVDPEDEDLEKLSAKVLEVGNGWVGRAAKRREFASKPLRITGIVLYEDGAVAIINDRVVRVGDRFDEMAVVEIQPNQVVLDYQGEDVPLVFRRY